MNLQILSIFLIAACGTAARLQNKARSSSRKFKLQGQAAPPGRGYGGLPAERWDHNEGLLSDVEVDAWKESTQAGKCNAPQGHCCVMGHHSPGTPDSGIHLQDIFGQQLEKCTTLQKGRLLPVQEVIRGAEACPIYAEALQTPWLGPARCECNAEQTCWSDGKHLFGAPESSESCEAQTFNEPIKPGAPQSTVLCASHPDAFKPEHWKGWQDLKETVRQSQERYEYILFLLWEITQTHKGETLASYGHVQRASAANVRKDLRFAVMWSRQILLQLENEVFPHHQGMADTWLGEAKWLVGLQHWLKSASGQDDWGLDEEDPQGLKLVTFMTDHDAMTYADAHGLKSAEVDKARQIAPIHQDAVALQQSLAHVRKRYREEYFKEHANGKCSPVYVFNSHWTGTPFDAEQTLIVKVLRNSASKEHQPTPLPDPNGEPMFSVPKEGEWKEHGDPLVCLGHAEIVTFQITSSNTRTEVTHGARTAHNHTKTVTKQVQTNVMLPEFLCVQIRVAKPKKQKSGDAWISKWTSRSPCKSTVGAREVTDNDLWYPHVDKQGLGSAALKCEWPASYVKKQVQTGTHQEIVEKTSTMLWMDRKVKESHLQISLELQSVLSGGLPSNACEISPA